MTKKNITKSKYWKYKNQKINNNFLKDFIKSFFQNTFTEPSDEAETRNLS